jgi:KDO2-lipid IV(A) lauroyltransferase
MPLDWRYGIARFISDRIYDWRPSIRNATRSNIRHVLGPSASDEEVDRIARQCARNTGRYYADVVGMHRMDIKKFHDNDLVLEGLHWVNEATARGQGVVMVSAHYANPEFATQGLAAAGLRVFAIVEDLQPPELGKLMWDLRNVHGHRYEPVGYRGVRNAIQWLRDGGVVAILCDRDIQKRGIEIELCGYPAKFPTGPVDLAIRTNSALIPGWVRREGGYKIHAVIGPPLEIIRTGNHDEDIRVNTKALLDRFEKHLRKDPGQWSVLDRIWPGDVPRDAKPEPSRAGKGIQ